jgi:hypothetical protein
MFLQDAFEEDPNAEGFHSVMRSRKDRAGVATEEGRGSAALPRGCGLHRLCQLFAQCVPVIAPLLLRALAIPVGLTTGMDSVVSRFRRAVTKGTAATISH